MVKLKRDEEEMTSLSHTELECKLKGMAREIYPCTTSACVNTCTHMETSYLFLVAVVNT